MVPVPEASKVFIVIGQVEDHARRPSAESRRPHQALPVRKEDAAVTPIRRPVQETAENSMTLLALRGDGVDDMTHFSARLQSVDAHRGAGGEEIQAGPDLRPIGSEGIQTGGHLEPPAAKCDGEAGRVERRRRWDETCETVIQVAGRCRANSENK